MLLGNAAAETEPRDLYSIFRVPVCLAWYLMSLVHNSRLQPDEQSPRGERDKLAAMHLDDQEEEQSDLLLST